MKKILYTLGFAAMSLLALSCAKEEEMAPDTKPEVNGKYTLVAEMESSVQTRTTPELVEGTTNQYRLHWAEGDKLSVFVGTMGMGGQKEFTLCDGAGTTTGTFTGDLDDSQSIVFAAYPYNANHSVMGSFIMPSVYGDIETEYTPNTNAYMMAQNVAAGNEEGVAPKLSFMHLGGVLALDLYGIPANVKGVVLTANKGITGEASFADEVMEGELSAKDSDGTNNSITIYFKPKATVRNEIFYFPLPVGTYQFKVEYIAADDQKILVIDSKKDNEIKRAGIKTMPELTVAPLAKISFSDVTMYDAKVSIDVAKGYDGDFVYYIQPLGGNISDFSAEEAQQKIDAQINSATSSADQFSDGKYYAANGSLLAWYKNYYKPSATFNVGHTIFVALVPKSKKTGSEGPDVAPTAVSDNEEDLPGGSGQSTVDSSLDADHIIYALVTLKGYTISEDAKANVQIAYDPAAQTYDKVTATMTPDSGVSYRYSKALTPEQYDAVKDNDSEMLKLVGANVYTDKKTFTHYCSFGETYYLLVHAFDSATGDGKIQVQKLESRKVTFNEGIELNLEVLHKGFRYVDVKIEATGGELKQIRWGYMKKSEFEANATLTANGTELEKMMELAEEQLAVDKTIRQRGEITKANFAEDNRYSIENMYYEEDTYLCVIGYDNSDVPTKMVYTLLDLNETDPIASFDANLAAPEVKDVYYIANYSGYNQALDNWTNMKTVDVNTLDDKTGMYWLDLDWSKAGGEPKRMWLSSDNDLNDPSKGLITGDAKKDALATLLKRSGSSGGSGSAPDFYGRSTSTGKLSLSPVLFGTTESKTLRNKKTNPISPKTLYLVWETNDGKYGYTTVVPEKYAPLPKPGNIQATFTMEGMGPAAIDFGVTTPGYLAIAIDLEAFFEEDCLPQFKGWYQAYPMLGNPIGSAYEVIATDASSGVIRVTVMNNMGLDAEPVIKDYPYSGYVNNKTPFTIDGDLVGSSEDEVVITPVSEPVKVYIEGVTPMPEVEYAKPDNIQVKFTMAEMGDTPAVLDFGVTTPGKLVVGIDGAAKGYPFPGMYVLWQSFDYEMVAADATSGVIRIGGKDYAYSGYADNSTSFTVDGSFVGEDDFEVTPVSTPIQIFDMSDI